MLLRKDHHSLSPLPFPCSPCYSPFRRDCCGPDGTLASICAPTTLVRLKWLFGLAQPSRYYTELETLLAGLEIGLITRAGN